MQHADKSKHQKFFLCLLKNYLLKKRVTQILPSLIFLFAFLSLPASATNNTTLGTIPYYILDNDESVVIGTPMLLTIKLTNGRIYSVYYNPSTERRPIELPVEGQTFADVKMFMPIDKTTVNLSELITPKKLWENKDEAGQAPIGITISGTLTLKIEDSNGNAVKRDDKLTACEEYYKITLTNSAGNIKSQSVNSNGITFSAGIATYYIKSKLPAIPYVCNAQPNMKDSGIKYSRNNHSSNEKLDGPYNEWDNKRGFKPQDINTPSSNFPTTGAHGLFFNLTIAGDVWQNMSYDKSPIDSGIDISISNGGSPNNAKVLLSGPRYKYTHNAITAVPTTFTIYSDKEKTNKIYTFTINRWFIATPGVGNGYKAYYCSKRYGSGYRIPSVAEYTNANNRSENWTDGLSEQPNNYQRRIGGGLFAEWGNLNGTTYYTDSDFDFNWYWAIEKYKSNQRFVGSLIGFIASDRTNIKEIRLACVTP